MSHMMGFVLGLAGLAPFRVGAPRVHNSEPRTRVRGRSGRVAGRRRVR